MDNIRSLDLEGFDGPISMGVTLRANGEDATFKVDVAYNHDGGYFTNRDLCHFDGQLRGDRNDSLYFTDQGWAGGLVFAYWKNQVRQFLIDNALLYLNEYPADGFCYDEVGVIRNEEGRTRVVFLPVCH